MEITRRNNNNNQLSRSSILRDWGPTLVRIGKMAYQQSLQSKNSQSNEAGDRSVDFSTQSVRAGTKRRGQRQRNARSKQSVVGIPATVQGRIYKCVLTGSIIAQSTGGTFLSSYLIGFDPNNNQNQLVTDERSHGMEFTQLKGFGFLKYHKVTVTVSPVLAATDAGWGAIALRSVVDTTPSTPSYVKKVPGSKTWVFPAKQSVSYTPDSNQGVIHRSIQTESPEVHEEHAYTGSFKIYMSTANSVTNAVIGVINYSIDVSAWND